MNSVFFWGVLVQQNSFKPVQKTYIKVPMSFISLWKLLKILSATSQSPALLYFKSKKKLLAWLKKKTKPRLKLIPCETKRAKKISFLRMSFFKNLHHKFFFPFSPLVLAFVIKRRKKYVVSVLNQRKRELFSLKRARATF